MKQLGTLVLLSDTAFKLSDLTPRDSKRLEEDQNFILARNRFASESVFLYVDVKTIEQEEKDREKKWEEEEQKRAESEAARAPVPAESPENKQTEMTSPGAEEPSTLPPDAELVVPESVPDVAVAEPQTSNDATLSAAPQGGKDEVSPFIFSLWGALFGGQSKWPDAVAAAIGFEGDAYVVRTLIINPPENKATAIPFAPQFVSGPALVPESPNIFPADVDLFVSASLDYVQVYEGMIKALAEAEQLSRKYARRYGRAGVKEEPAPESPFVAYEKKLGLKIKDDILPLLGNELAMALPKPPPPPAPTASPASPADSGDDKTKPTAGTQVIHVTPPVPTPVVAISIKDREAVARLIPKIVESLGFKGANLFAQTEKRDGVEIVSYGDIFVYAFVDNFLVVSADAGATRQVVDSYLNHQTLSSNTVYRNSRRWQPRQFWARSTLRLVWSNSTTRSLARAGVPIKQ